MRPPVDPERLPDGVRSLALRVLALREYDAGRVGVPSERAKRRHLLDLFRRGGHRVLVESGTYLGGTVAFFLPHAERIVSVEVDERLFLRARERFAAEPKVQLVHGDSLREVPQLVAALDAPPLVWLDGHYSGGQTGKGEEAEPALAILERLAEVGPPAGTTLVVDDLRLFGSDPEVPALDALVDTASRAFPAAELRAGLDSLVIRTRD